MILRSLPEEVQERVFGYCTTPSLKNLSATSWAYNRALKPLLFRTVQLHAARFCWMGFFEKHRCAKFISQTMKYTETLNVLYAHTCSNCKIPKCVYRAISKAKRLRELNIEGEQSYVSHKSFSILCDGLTSLQRLSVRHTRGITDIAVASIGKLMHLEELCLRSTGITSVGLSYISKLTNLNKLDLSETSVSDHGLSFLAKGSSSALKTLILENCWNLFNRCMHHINKLSQLEELAIAGCSVTPHGILHVTLLKRLRKLYCDGACISNDTLLHMSTHLGALNMLIISGPLVDDIDQRNVNYLREICPFHV